MLNIAKIKEPIIKDIENVGFDRAEIEKCFEKLVRKGLENMSNKEIKQAIILELTKPKGKGHRANKPTQEEMLQAITQ